MRLKFILFSIVCIHLVSCSKDEYIDSLSRIQELSLIGKENSRRYEMRLAFGKALAGALVEPELRNFIKAKSQYNDTIFNELVFALIKNDKLPSGKTVAQLLFEYEDEEIKSLFGDSLQEVLRIKDPLISLKLPDVFAEVDWETEKIIPLVGVETPTPLIEAHYGGKYMFYYYNGYQELVSPLSHKPYGEIKHFFIMVKYSNDHFLINRNKLQNEKGQTLYEFMPQLRNCSVQLMNDIFGTGSEDNEEKGWFFLNKRICYQTWLLKTRYSGEYYLDNNEPCSSFCPRDCISSSLKHNVVFDSYDIYNDLFYRELGFLFTETFSISFRIQHIFKDNTTVNKRFTILGKHYREFGNGKCEVTMKPEYFSCDGGRFVLPFVSISYTSFANSSAKIPVRYMITDFFKEGEKIRICVSAIYYNDLIKSVNNELACPDSENFDIINATYETGQGTSVYSWCINDTEISGNNVSFMTIKY